MYKVILIALAGLLFSGCAVGKMLMPYEEEVLCNKGKETGYCGSVTEVYETIIYKEQQGDK
ncbi:MAG: hypothetical protein RBS91_08480 [Sulfurimonadaceae bacterium]|jgi:hypothetical protein|nr:hypothetical protein [Sulfurimonadaceae bacterium]